MVYFLLAIFLIIYCELLGQTLLDYLHYPKPVYSLGVGLIAILAFAYLSSSILSALNLSFFILLFIYGAGFLASLFFIFRKRKNLTFDFYHVIIMAAAVMGMTYYSYKTTLGDLNGFDSTFYLNMVTGNMGNPVLNSISVYHGVEQPTIQLQYAFQSFYYLASVFLYVIYQLYALVGRIFNPAPAFIWIFQTLYDALFVSLIINACERFFKGKKIMALVVLTFFILLYFRIYFNSAFGFFGNTYRTIILGYTAFFLIDYLKDNIQGSELLFVISIWAACAVSSSAIFMAVFLLYALFYLLVDKEDKLFKKYAVILLMPMINLLAILTNSMPKSIIGGIIFCIILYLLNDGLIGLIRRYKLKKIFLALGFIAMTGLSYYKCGTIFNLDVFIYNYAEQNDMTLNYFRYTPDAFMSIKIYKIVSLVLLVLAMIVGYREKMIQLIFILFLIFFNPFCCGVLDRLMVVWSRAYDLIFNPFLMIYMLHLINTRFKWEYLPSMEVVIIIALLMVVEQPLRILYHHYSFVPSDDYDPIMKMKDDEYDMIAHLRYMIDDYHLDNPKIISPNVLTQSNLAPLRAYYLFGRGNQYNPKWGDSEYLLYGIFFPIEYYGDPRQPENPDYEHMCEYIEDVDIDFIVQTKNWDYYDEEQNIWYSLTYLIDHCGTYPAYENEGYALYYFE